VEKFLEDPLAEEFLRGNIQQGDMLEVHAAGEQLALKVTVKYQPSFLTFGGQVPNAESIVGSLSGAILGAGTIHIPATPV
jgi:hypothetical protein